MERGGAIGGQTHRIGKVCSDRVQAQANGTKSERQLGGHGGDGPKGLPRGFTTLVRGSELRMLTSPNMAAPVDQELKKVQGGRGSLKLRARSLI